MKTITENYRWRIVALLFFATTINYIDRQVIGILKPIIAEDLGWTEAGYGYIVSAFQFAYAIGLVLSGWFLDRIGTKTGYTVAILFRNWRICEFPGRGKNSSRMVSQKREGPGYRMVQFGVKYRGSGRACYCHRHSADPGLAMGFYSYRSPGIYLDYLLDQTIPGPRET